MGGGGRGVHFETSRVLAPTTQNLNELTKPNESSPRLFSSIMLLKTCFTATVSVTYRALKTCPPYPPPILLMNLRSEKFMSHFPSAVVPWSMLPPGADAPLPPLPPLPPVLPCSCSDDDDDDDA